MPFQMNAVLTDPEHGLTLESLTAILRNDYAADSDTSELVREEGASPDEPPHLRYVCRETDMGTPGQWDARIFLESGEEIRLANRDHVACSRNRSPCPDAIRQATSRVRIVFSSDDRRRYTNTMVHLMAFLEDLPGAIVYDPQQDKFLL